MKCVNCFIQTVLDFSFKIRLLAVAAQMLQEEAEQKKKEREAALAERVPPVNLSGLSLQELLVFHYKRVFSHLPQ